MVKITKTSCDYKVLWILREAFCCQNEALKVSLTFVDIYWRAQTLYREKGSGHQPMHELSQRNAIAV
jgi:hypothetical protein